MPVKISNCVFLLILTFCVWKLACAQDCPDIDVPENVTIVSNTSTEISFNCNVGFNLTSGDLHIECVNNTWEGDIPTCSIIECSPLNIESQNNFNNYTGINTIGTVIDITCKSGYQSNGYSHSMILCNLNGQWEPDHPGFSFACNNDISGNGLKYLMIFNHGIDTMKITALSNHKPWILNNYIRISFNGEGNTITRQQLSTWANGYIGCMNSSLLNPVLTDATPIRSTCRSLCKNTGFRYMMLTNSSCLCGIHGNRSSKILNNDYCNATCTDSITNGFCGGHNGEQSVYHIWDGCYDNLKVNASVVKSISGNKLKTCKQFCFGYGSFYGILNMVDSTCTCAEFINIDAVYDITPCTSESYNNGTSSYVYNTGETKAAHSSCEKLYANGVRLNGNYTLKGIQESTFCFFKDGTECDDMWVGFNGSCYLFNEQNYDFEQARSYCTSMNSTLVSILHSSEQDFITEYFKVYGSGGGKWLIGLYSSLSDGTYMWTDGHLYQYSNFADKEPAILVDDVQCVMIYENNNYWFTWNCNKTAPFICKKSVDYNCIHPTSKISNTNSTSLNGDLTLTLCIQICKSQSEEYAAVQNGECKCLSQPSMVNVTATPYNQCDTTCKGNNGQMCGGATAFTVIKVDGHKKPHSCEELELIGIGGLNFYLEGKSSLQFCPETACPQSWIKGNSSCYKFISGQLQYNDMIAYCSKHDAYVVCLEDSAEKSFVLSIVKATEQYQNVARWMIGLYSYIQSDPFRWFSNMRSIDINSSEIVPNDDLKKYYGVKSDGSYIGHDSLGDYSSFICEHNEGYLGCFEVQSNGSSVITQRLDIYEYTDIVQCIEWCRALGSTYMMIGGNYLCACSDSLPLKYDGEFCPRICEVGQPCGGNDNYVSLYDIGKYPVYDSCEELFKAGISLSGNYSLKNGSHHCLFYDQETVCSEKWVGFRGNCYMGLQVIPNMAITGARDQCRSIAGTLATIRDSVDQEVLLEYLSASTWLGQYQGTLFGLLNTFGLGLGTWASGEITNYFPYSEDKDKSQKYHYIDSQYKHKPVFKSSASEITWGNVLCEIPKDFSMGCFNITNLSLSPILTNWMELTLCKQLCLGQGTQYAGIQNNACFCLNDTKLNEMTTLTLSECSSLCPGNIYQYCGTGDAINVFSLDSAVLAESCDVLYNFGIFQKAIYPINSSNTTEMTECGFSDSTVCDAGWYGYFGTCYRFFLQPTTYIAASQMCLNNSGFLLTPTILNIDFLTKMLGTSVFSAFDYWWTNLFDQFGGNIYLSSDGKRSAETTIVMIDSSDFLSNYVVFSSNGTLHRNGTGTSKLPCICQTSNGYIGCVDKITIDANITGTVTTNSGMTSTFCIQLCRGQDASFAGIHSSTTCQCYSGLQSYTLLSSSCLSCPGYRAQPCGSSESISVFNVSMYADDVFGSCDELLSYGITEPGWYYIKPPNATQSTKVKCFQPELSLTSLELNPTITATSSHTDYTPSKSRIRWPFVVDDVWKPAVNYTNQLLTFTFSADILLTGIVTQGNPLDNNSEWTTSYSLIYYDVLLGNDQDYSRNGSHVSFTGNTDRGSLKYNYLTNPIITTVVSINPQAWNNWPAVRVQLLGQPLSLYNYSASIIGCYHMPHDMNQRALQSFSTSLTECKSKCLSLYHPFYSFTYNAVPLCFCWTTLPSTYGSFVDSVCNTTERLLVYRSYDKTCPEPTVIPYSNQTYDTSVQGSFVYRSSVTYTCDVGYIFNDRTRSKSLVCGQDNQWTGDIDICEAVICDDLALPSNSTANTNSTYYGIVVNVTCDIGFNIEANVKSQYLVCTEHNTWNSTIEDCKRINCGEPPTIALADRVGHLYDYNNTVVYMCPDHMWFGTSQFNISIARCTEEATWENIPSQCTYYECPEPTSILHASYVRTGADTAVYTCDSFYRFSNNGNSMTLTCNQNFTWEQIKDVCRRQDDQVCFRSTTSTIMSNIVRHSYTTDDILSEFVPRSRSSCAGACLSDWQCQGYNYKTDLCRLFNKKPTTAELKNDPEWQYFEKNNEELQSC